MKKCRICEVEKDILEFHKRNEKLYRNECKECTSKIKSEYHIKNREKILEKKKTYTLLHKEEKSFYDKNRRLIKYEYNLNRNRKYRKNNPKYYEWAKKYNTKYRKDKKYIFIWRGILKSCLIRMNIKKSDKTINLLNYSSNQLKLRIECQFKDGMSWDNYGKWHVDHKKPISKFEKDSPIHIVNALCNLQPLWAFENLSKGNKF